MDEAGGGHVKPPRWQAVDLVALVLALGLSLAIVMILVVTGIQVVIGGSFPQVTLSDNATQIITTGMGGLTGLLGAYIGVNRKDKDPPSTPR